MTTEGNWRSPLARALHQSNRAPARHLQLATVTPEGHPANRTLLFREFREHPEGDQLCVHSDRRASKIDDLQAHPYAEVCWWLDETRDQFRIAGSVHLITAATTGDDAAYRQEQWKELDDHEKTLYISPDPGAPRADEEAFDKAFSTTPPEDPPDTFVVLLLSPTRIDHLSLSGHPHRRTRYTRTDERWTEEELNP